MPDVRVLIVDDQEPFRRAMAAVVEETDGFEVGGFAVTGEESLTAVAELRPDLVLMDIHLPGHRRHRGHPAHHLRSRRPGGRAAVDVRRGPVRPRRVRVHGVHRQGRLRPGPASRRLGRRPRPGAEYAGARPTGMVTSSTSSASARVPPTASTRSSTACRSRPVDAVHPLAQPVAVEGQLDDGDLARCAPPRRSRSRPPPPPAARTARRPPTGRRAGGRGSRSAPGTTAAPARSRTGPAGSGRRRG